VALFFVNKKVPQILDCKIATNKGKVSHRKTERNEQSQKYLQKKLADYLMIFLYFLAFCEEAIWWIL